MLHNTQHTVQANANESRTAKGEHILTSLGLALLKGLHSLPFCILFEHIFFQQRKYIPVLGPVERNIKPQLPIIIFKRMHGKNMQIIFLKGIRNFFSTSREWGVKKFLCVVCLPGYIVFRYKIDFLSFVCKRVDGIFPELNNTSRRWERISVDDVMTIFSTWQMIIL